MHKKPYLGSANSANLHDDDPLNRQVQLSPRFPPTDYTLPPQRCDMNAESTQSSISSSDNALDLQPLPPQSNSSLDSQTARPAKKRSSAEFSAQPHYVEDTTPFTLNPVQITSSCPHNLSQSHQSSHNTFQSHSNQQHHSNNSVGSHPQSNQPFKSKQSQFHQSSSTISSSSSSSSSSSLTQSTQNPPHHSAPNITNSNPNSTHHHSHSRLTSQVLAVAVSKSTSPATSTSALSITSQSASQPRYQNSLQQQHHQLQLQHHHHHHHYHQQQHQGQHQGQSSRSNSRSPAKITSDHSSTSISKDYTHPNHPHSNYQSAPNQGHFSQLGNNFRDLVGEQEAYIYDNYNNYSNNHAHSSAQKKHNLNANAKNSNHSTSNLTNHSTDQFSSNPPSTTHSSHSSHSCTASNSHTPSNSAHSSQLSSTHHQSHQLDNQVPLSLDDLTADTVQQSSTLQQQQQQQQRSSQHSTRSTHHTPSRQSYQSQSQQYQQFPQIQPTPSNQKSRREIVYLRNGSHETDEDVLASFHPSKHHSRHPHPFLAYPHGPVLAQQAVDPDQVLLTLRHLRVIEYSHYYQGQFNNFNSNEARRKSGVDFLKQLVTRFSIALETYELATVYFDRILLTQQGRELADQCTDYLPLTCMMVASKFNDPPAKRFTYGRFEVECQFQLNMNIFRDCEYKILCLLDFRLHIPITSHFLALHQHCGILFTNDIIADSLVPTVQNVTHLESYIAFFHEIYNSYKTRYYPPSLAAAAIIAGARYAIGCTPVWNEKLSTTTRYSPAEFHDCFNDIYSVFKSWYPDLNTSPALAVSASDESSQCNVGSI